MKKSHSNDKHLEKITSSSYHKEQKIFIEGSCIYNMHGKLFAVAAFEGLWVGQIRLGQIKKPEGYFGLNESSFTFIEKRRPSKYCLCEVNSISYMYVFSLIHQTASLARKIPA